MVSAEFPPMVGGVGAFATNLATALQSQGARVQVITCTRSTDGDDPLSVDRLMPKLNKKIVKLAPLLAGAGRAVSRDKPDWVLAMQWTHDGTVAYLLRKLTGIPYVVVVHGADILLGRSRLLRFQAMVRVLEAANLVVANSVFTKGLIDDLRLHLRRVVVINPPIKIPDARHFATDEVEQCFKLSQKRVLLTAARLVRRKGHAEVIQVLAKIADRYPDLVYVITGVGPARAELQRLAERLGVADRVRFTGYVSAAQLDQLYARAEIYVSPSLLDGTDVEGFGMALAEAGAHGKPVIAGRTGGVAEAVEEGRTGLLVDPSNLDEIQDSLVRLLDDPGLRDKLGRQGRTRVGERFGLDRQGEYLLRELQSLTASAATQ